MVCMRVAHLLTTPDSSRYPPVPCLHMRLQQSGGNTNGLSGRGAHTTTSVANDRATDSITRHCHALHRNKHVLDVPLNSVGSSKQGCDTIMRMAHMEAYVPPPPASNVCHPTSVHDTPYLIMHTCVRQLRTLYLPRGSTLAKKWHYDGQYKYKSKSTST